jgi:Fe-S-cluster containining protein
MPPPFTRTTCACPEDVANCKKQPGPLAPSDLAPITERLIQLGIYPENVSKLFEATPGTTIARIKPAPGGHEIEIIQIPTISPATIDGHRCIFLMDDDRCGIHDVAPFGCAYYDAHMDSKEASARSLWMAQQIANSPEYTAYRSTLKEKA